MPALVNPKYKQSASCGYEVMMVVQVVEVWGDVDVVFENHERFEARIRCSWSISALRMDTIPFTPDLRPMIPGGPVPQCDVAIGMIKVLLDDVLSNVFSVLTSVQYV
jgi:hypothetical protein